VKFFGVAAHIIGNTLARQEILVGAFAIETGLTRVHHPWPCRSNLGSCRLGDRWQRATLDGHVLGKRES
jgi:hypothetical protein